MARLRNINSGAVVSCSDETAARMGSEWVPFDGATKTDSGNEYAGQKVAELKAEIESRNEGREEDALISLEGNKAALIAALEADDASSVEES